MNEQAGNDRPRSEDFGASPAPRQGRAWGGTPITAGDGVGSPVRGVDLLVVLGLTAGLLILARLLIGAPPRTVAFVFAMLALQSVIPMAAIYLVIVRGRGVGWSRIGFRPAPARWYLWGALIALASLPVVALVNYAVQALLGMPFRNPQVDLLAPAGFSWPALFGMLAMAGVVAPIVEETVFRGLLYGWLRARLGIGLGVAVSAVAFAFAHGILVLVPALLVHGVILALVYERAASLWPPIIVHGTFNIVMTLALYGALAAGVTPG